MEQPTTGEMFARSIDEDDEIPSFHQLRANLLGKVPTSFMPEAVDVPASMPNTVHMRAAAPKVDPLPGRLGDRGGAAASDESMSANFEALRASITSKLRGASSDAMRASGVPMGPDTATLGRQEAAGPTEMFGGGGANPSTVAATGSNTVMLTARKPGACGGGMTVVASLDSNAAASHGAGLGPPQRKRVNVTTAGAAAHIAASADERSHDATAASAAASAAFASGVNVRAVGSDGLYGESAASEMTFGYLAMRSALDSHKAHYEAARSKLPAVAQYRPTSGLGAPPPPPPVPKSYKAPAKPPHLATANRARSTPEVWNDALPGEKPMAADKALERLKAAATNGATPRASRPASSGRDLPKASKPREARKPEGGSVAFGASNYGHAASAQAQAAAKRVPAAAKPKPSARIPISRPAAGGMPGGAASLPANNAPLCRVSGSGLAPSLDRTRETERLVAAVVQSAPPPAPEGPAFGAMCKQFTEGHGAQPMSAQQAWQANARGAARQAEVLGAVASHSATLYRSTMESIATN